MREMKNDSFFIIRCNWILICSAGQGDLLHVLSSQKYIPNAPNSIRTKHWSKCIISIIRS